MENTGVQPLLRQTAGSAEARLRLSPRLCGGAAMAILCAGWGLSAYWSALASDLDDPLLWASAAIIGATLGLGSGLLGTHELWRWLRRRYYGGLQAAVRTNLLDSGLLLMALEPVPAAALLEVYDVPGRESGAPGQLALPQAPRALSAQSFAQRLRLLVERYVPACRALRCAPWPDEVLALQRLLAIARAALPVVGISLLLLQEATLLLPEAIALLLPPVFVALLVARSAADDMLRAMQFAAVRSIVAAELGSPEQSPDAAAESAPKMA